MKHGKKIVYRERSEDFPSLDMNFTARHEDTDLGVEGFVSALLIPLIQVVGYTPSQIGEQLLMQMPELFKSERCASESVD